MRMTATLDVPSFTLEPGAEGGVRLTVRNDSDVVEEYILRVVGPLEPWADAQPDRFSLYPGQEATAEVQFRPPRSSSFPAGEFKYGVHILPREHPEGAELPEGTVDVLPFHETTGEIMPRMSRGKVGARHNVAVDNRGNVPVTVDLAGSDPGDLLEFVLRPSELTIEPGTVQFTAVRVRPAEKIWRGTPATHSFAVTATPSDGLPILLEGNHVQDPMLPWRAIKAVLCLLLLALALTVGWHVMVESVRISDPMKSSLAHGAASSIVSVGSR